MRDDSTDEATDVTRRTFMKATGVAAGSALVGSGLSGSAAAAHGDIDTDLLNLRVQEARRVWERGYRGHPERTIGLTDTGVDTRHPDLGPWNGITAISQGGELKLTTPEAIENQGSTLIQEYSQEEGNTRFSGTAQPGTFVEGSEQVAGTFVAPENSNELDAKLFWSPYEDNTNDLEFRIDHNVGTEDSPEWEQHARAATAGMPEVIGGAPLVPGEQYRYVVEQYANSNSTYRIEEQFYAFTALEDDITADDVFAHDGDGPRPKTVGWVDPNNQFGVNHEPADSGGHGTHVASIMGGSGRASTIGSLQQEEPNAVLTAGDFLEYEVTAQAGTGVFAGAVGDGIEVVISGPDGEELRRSAPPGIDSEVFLVGFSIGLNSNADASLVGNNLIDHPTVHDSGTATYTVHVRPLEGEAVSTARVEKVAVGSFEDPDAADNDGDRTAGAGDPPSLHSGIAPDAGLVGLQGFSGPVNTLAKHAEAFTDAFGLRSVNMSWSFVDPVAGYGTPPLGAAGGQLTGLVGKIRQLAEGGILTVAAGSNSFAPTQTSAPALADESISVIATGPLDGITEYSSAGMAAQDEDGDGQYVKPDVTAPGGTLDNSIRAARAGPGDAPAEEVRDYVRKPGTSMASPYVNGVIGLVAEAMDADVGGAPDSIALPVPSETGFDDVMRLKQTVLATASQTAFTAAPYHRNHYPTYRHGERDIYEGYGRVNPDAAVDAVTRDLLPDLSEPTAIAPKETAQATHDGTVGLDAPADPRAVAGYVEVRGGTLDVSVDFSHYAGGNKGMAKDAPWLDLFVYDAENPSGSGEPNIVASAQGQQGSASVSVDVERRGSRDGAFNTRTFYVVAKLVNVPGVVNGYDVRAHFDLGVSYTAAEQVPLPSFNASGSRSDDGRVFTQGSTDEVNVTVSGFSDGVSEVRVTDFVPDGWTVQEGFGDVEGTESVDGGTVVDLGTVSASAVETDATVERTYFVEATGGTGDYTFGPAAAEIVGDASGFSGERAEFGGTDSNAIVGADQNTSASDAGGTVTDTVTDTL